MRTTAAVRTASRKSARDTADPATNGDGDEAEKKCRTLFSDRPRQKGRRLCKAETSSQSLSRLFTERRTQKKPDLFFQGALTKATPLRKVVPKNKNNPPGDGFALLIGNRRAERGVASRGH